MPGLAEYLLAMRGCARLARFDASFLNYFDRSSAGARRSFGIAVPVYFYYLALILNPTEGGPVEDFGRYLFSMTVGYVFLWISFPLLLLAIGELTDWRDRVVGTISVYNWSALLTVALHLPIFALKYLGWWLPVASILDIVALIYVLVLSGFVLRCALGVKLVPTVLLVLGDFALSQLIIQPTFTYLGHLP